MIVESLRAYSKVNSRIRKRRELLFCATNGDFAETNEEGQTVLASDIANELDPATYFSTLPDLLKYVNITIEPEEEKRWQEIVRYADSFIKSGTESDRGQIRMTRATHRSVLEYLVGVRGFMEGPPSTDQIAEAVPLKNIVGILQALEAQGFVIVDNDRVWLTREGAELGAREVIARHRY